MVRRQRIRVGVPDVALTWGGDRGCLGHLTGPDGGQELFGARDGRQELDCGCRSRPPCDGRLRSRRATGRNAAGTASLASGERSVAAFGVGRGVHRGTGPARPAAVRDALPVVPRRIARGQWTGARAHRSRIPGELERPEHGRHARAYADLHVQLYVAELFARQQIADVLSFVLSVNKLPAGDVELPRQSELLSPIKFLAQRPSGDPPPDRRPR